MLMHAIQASRGHELLNVGVIPKRVYPRVGNLFRKKRSRPKHISSRQLAPGIPAFVLCCPGRPRVPEKSMNENDADTTQN